MTRPEVHVMMRGISMGCDQSNLALSAVYLVEAADEAGSVFRILYDCSHLGRRKLLLAALAGRDLAPSDIDVLVLSHAHWDHVQNVDLFQASRVLIHADELEYVRAPRANDHATPQWTRSILTMAGAEPTCDGEVLAPGVRVMHLPGHTAGSIGLSVRTADGQAILTGDAVASVPAAVRGECSGVYFDVAKADASVLAVREQADVIYPGHDRPFRVIDRTRTEYLVETVPIRFNALDAATMTGDVSFEERSYAERFILPGAE